MSAGPVGSGKFARAMGFGFIAAAAAVLVWDVVPIQVDPIYILAGWLLASGAIAILWGRNRIKTGNPEDHRIGMDTINMIVTMIGVAFAIAALISRA